MSTKNYTRGLCWSQQQIEALARIEDWLQNRNKPYFYLDGFAGTGKSTLAQEIARRAGGRVVFAAFTGKAAAVMRQKGCEGATTIDSLIYQPQIAISCIADPPCHSPPCSDRCKYVREHFVGRSLNQDSALADADLCIIDEVSMVGEEMGNDLLSFGVPVLVLGDTAQLPPIDGYGFFTRHQPDFQLTEIHRQEANSPIIKLATRVREGWQLIGGNYGRSSVVSSITTEAILGFNQVICGTHRTRHQLNTQIREARGFRGPIPRIGEKVLCLKNDHAAGLQNGTIWIVEDVAWSDPDFVGLTISNENDRLVDVVAPREGFSSRDGNGSGLPGQPFAFGYAITCHKSQGSEWNSVLVIDESRVFREHCDRWLYTAITRAAKRVTVVS